LPALASCIDRLAPNGGRPQHCPAWALARLGKPQGPTAARLTHALDHEDFRVRDASASVLAEFADDDELFDALWSRRERMKTSDGTASALLRAAEVRRDPIMREHLEWMAGNKRFRSAGYPARIRAARDGLRAP
jgi:hypothetical protein